MCCPMLKPSTMVEEETQQAPAKTLGDVLYAKSKALVPEQEWTMLVQSIASKATGEVRRFQPFRRSTIGRLGRLQLR